MKVEYMPGAEFLRRHINSALIAEIDRKQSKTFINDHDKEEIYNIISGFVWDRCCPVISRNSIAEIISGFQIVDSEEEAEEEDCWTLSSGRILA